MILDTSRPLQSPILLNGERAASHASAGIATNKSHGRDGASESSYMPSLRETCADLYTRVTNFLSVSPADDVTRSTQEQTRVAMSVIEKALADYDFDALSISYNGGKDCLVLLILYLAVLHTHFTQPVGRRRNAQQDNTAAQELKDTFPPSIPSVYAKPPDPFDSVTSFVDTSTKAYHLDLTHITTNPGPGAKAKSHSSPPSTAVSHTLHNISTTANGTTNTVLNPLTLTKPDAGTNNNNNNDDENASDALPTLTFRDAFALYLHTHPSIKAIFVGTRRTDPHGTQLDHFQMTDGNWPRFMRIHPVIDWRLCEIWCFLRSTHLADPRTGERLEYCGVYDEGYTSLGGVNDTWKNPKLRYVDDLGVERYRPAYEMTEDHEERAGRE